MTTSLRDRRREQLRRELADAALRLAAERGWDAVTVAEVSEAAGVSRRAFFTHFASKDDALVHGATDDLAVLEAALEERPPEATFLEVLRERAGSWVDDMGALAATRRRRRQVESEVPGVAVKVTVARAAALRDIALPHLARDLGVGPEHPLAVMTASAFAGIGTALDELFAAEPERSAEHVATSLGLLEALVERAAEQARG